MRSVRGSCARQQQHDAARALRCIQLFTAALFVQLTPIHSAPAQTRAQRDSINAHAEAVNILRMFEYRHSTLVRGPGSFNMGSMFPLYADCELTIGDYCYGPKNGGIALGGFGSTPAGFILAPTRYTRQFRSRSNALVNSYRNDLRRQLRKIPGDLWLNSELVRVDVERRDFVRAMESAAECKAEKWWCNALGAYVIHQSGLWRRADSAWTTVLEGMPESERCAWLDPTWAVKDKEFREHYAAATCAEQIRIAERVWWLADPLYSIAGNERRSEHLSRLVNLTLTQWYRQHRLMTPAMAQAEADLHSGRPLVISAREAAEDMEGATGGGGNATRGVRLAVRRFGYPELVMRVGPPDHTAREEGTVRIVAQYPVERAAFMPMGPAAINHLHAKAGDWAVNDPFAFEFMAGWPELIRDIDYQVAHFRRGGAGEGADMTRVIGATDVSRDTVLQGRRMMSHLTIARDYNTPVVTQELMGNTVYLFDLTTTSDSALVSVELLDTSGTSGRVRFASGPPPMPDERVTLSDILLIHPGDPPATASDAAARAKGTTKILIGSTVGLFWEMYGVRASERLNLSVVVTQGRPGADGTPQRRGADSVLVTWEDARSAGDGIEARSLNLDLSSLRAGEYTVALAVEVPGQSRVVTRRGITIREPERP